VTATSLQLFGITLAGCIGFNKSGSVTRNSPIGMAEPSKPKGLLQREAVQWRRCDHGGWRDPSHIQRRAL